MRSAIRKIKGFVKPSFIAGFLLLIAFQPSYSYARDFNSVVVQLGSQAGDVEKRIAQMEARKKLNHYDAFLLEHWKTQVSLLIDKLMES